MTEFFNGEEVQCTNCVDHEHEPSSNPTIEKGDDDMVVGVPIIDLLNPDHDSIVQQIADACSTIGFFHVIHHGISKELIQDFRQQSTIFFTQYDKRELHRRNETNARGYFDNEYTKQRLDWKYAIDIGVPGSRNWELPDTDLQNRCLDGYNQIPNLDELPNFRSTVISYFEACAVLSNQIASLMMEGILLHLQHRQQSKPTINDSSKSILDQLGQEMIDDLRTNHTSYLRMNYYPPCPEHAVKQEHDDSSPPPLGISPHRDAGFLTILLQDDYCHSLQVPKKHIISTSSYPSASSSTSDQPQSHETIAEKEEEWYTILPIPGGLTINIGDMAQIWSNHMYKAPLHRVLTHPHQERYSAPFFYNPGYNTWIQPMMLFNIDSSGKISSRSCSIPQSMDDHPQNHEIIQNDTTSSTTTHQTQPQYYHPCLWGYFRAIRFAGDVTDLGMEIQVEDFLIRRHNDELCLHNEKRYDVQHQHIEQQQIFLNHAKVDEPFSIQQFRDLYCKNEKS
jgi:isopenicillin N synthase-like dioxygenase